MILFLILSYIIVVNCLVITDFTSESSRASNFKRKNNFNSQFSDFGTSVTLLRHANTHNNMNNIWTGQLDPGILDLNHPKVKMGNYDLVLCSSSLRCKQTLDILKFDNKPEIIFDDCFLEAGYGDLTGKKKNDDIFMREFFNRPPDSNIYVSESLFEAGLRSYFGFSLLSDRYTLFNSKILVLSHKNTLKGLWCFLNLDYILTQEDNKSIDQIEIDINNFLETKEIPSFENLTPYNVDLF
tara:strand:+ start:1442 stop:2161 length:720 start_codon:yes stop_codon:yes gene_type:complete